MKYEKPEVLAVESAAIAIQSGGKGVIPVPDQPLFQDTNGAYEADE